MVGGLWAGDTSLTQDFATVVWRLKLLGFNAVRLPFSFQVQTSTSLMLSFRLYILESVTIKEWRRAP